MQFSSTGLKKPYHIWLVLLIGIGIFLINIGTNLAVLSDARQKLQHEGNFRDLLK